MRRASPNAGSAGRRRGRGPYFMTIQHGPGRRNVSCRMITAERARGGSRHGEQLLHQDHTRHPLQTAFDGDALIVRAFQQPIERR
jgi:hypothetical protein